jgi:hypothetical protein
MRKTLLAFVVLGVSMSFSGGAQAGEADDAAAFQANMERVMVDILCNTAVIRDMNALGDVYLPRLRAASDPAARFRLKNEFGGKLHQAWYRQKYDMNGHQDIVRFLGWMVGQPMEGQVELARSWAVSAHQQCPAVAADYHETNAAALTLMLVIPH